MAFTEEQKKRYARHLVLKEIGLAGQEKLKNAKVLLIGAGGLGSAAGLYLAAAGVGTIGVADADVVELSNLQRQVLHTTADLGRPKVESAKETMLAINPDIRVIPYRQFVDERNIADLIGDYDFVLDATDNFDAKFLINDACVAAKKPFCHAGIFRFEGQMMTWVPNKDVPCYRCVFKEPPPKEASPTARQMGVVGAVAGVIGCMEAMEAIKYFTGAGELCTGQLLIYDALNNDCSKIRIPKDKTCSVCADG